MTLSDAQIAAQCLPEIASSHQENVETLTKVYIALKFLKFQ